MPNDLTTPKTKALLSKSTNRQELIDQRVCVACRTFPALSSSVHCASCNQRIGNADWKAFAGYLGEVERLG